MIQKIFHLLLAMVMVLTLYLPIAAQQNEKHNEKPAETTTAKAFPAQVLALKGAYQGSWTIFAIDENGQPVKRVSWTDTIKIDDPITKDGRAFLTAKSHMIFDGGRIPPQDRQWTEGCFINADGSAGEAFYEIFGQTYTMRKIDKATWTYSLPADERELASLGFTNVISAQHTMIKVIVSEGGVETHRISRLTTVNWKDQAGKERFVQYISLQGYHKRTA